MITSIEIVTFQRRSGGRIENGLLLNEGMLSIIDENGKDVGKVWNYDRTPGIALFNLKIGNMPKITFDQFTQNVTEDFKENSNMYWAKKFEMSAHIVDHGDAPMHSPKGTVCGSTNALLGNNYAQYRDSVCVKCLKIAFDRLEQ